MENPETTTTTTTEEPTTTTTSTTVDLNQEEHSDAFENRDGSNQSPFKPEDQVETITESTTVTAGASVTNTGTDLASDVKSPTTNDNKQTQDDLLAQARETAQENAAVGGLDADVDPNDRTRV